MAAPIPAVNNLVSFVHARRPTWQFIGEDNLLRIMCQQFIVDWKLIEQIQDTFKVEIRDVTSHATAGIVITLVFPAGE